MSETFHPIPGFHGYRVSDLGTVRRDDGLVMTPSAPRNRREYPCVYLRCGGRRHRVAVHRLVALTWIGPPPFAYAQVRHLDGDHMNPAASNLAWGTALDNAVDRETHGTTARGDRHGAKGRDFGGTNNPNAKLDDAAVANILRLSRQGHSTRMIAERTGASQRTVWAIVAGKSYTAAALRSLSTPSMKDA